MYTYCLMTFSSISYAIQFEKNAKIIDVPLRLIPVPRTISSSCGMCGKFDYKDKEQIINMCQIENIKYEKIYDYE